MIPLISLGVFAESRSDIQITKSQSAHCSTALGSSETKRNQMNERVLTTRLRENMFDDEKGDLLENLNKSLQDCGFPSICISECKGKAFYVMCKSYGLVKECYLVFVNSQCSQQEETGISEVGTWVAL